MGHYDDFYEYDAKVSEETEIRELKTKIKKKLKKINSIEKLILINKILGNISSISTALNVFNSSK